MLKRYAVVTTYPAHGSRNIGDWLISESMRRLILEKEPDAKVDIVWRAEDWTRAAPVLEQAQHVFFACLAIRPSMHSREYPFLRRFLETRVPHSVHSAGTDLPVHRKNDLLEDFVPETINLLQLIDRTATVFTTRGVLSQAAMEGLGLSTPRFVGDIAFADARFEQRKFKVNVPIRRIVVSDPHRPTTYRSSFIELVKDLQSSFPHADLRVALHGVNHTIRAAAADVGAQVVPIYEDPDHGLDLYNDADLHVGFRVHAHVSALKRRTYSYLLEQDGRGSDYGLTLERKISVAHPISPSSRLSPRALARWLFGRGSPTIHEVNPSGVAQLMALVRADARDGFHRFLGLDKSLRTYARDNRSAVHACLT